MVHPHLVHDARYVERFQREARLAASISHPNVIQVHEVGQDEDTHFMSLEYLPENLQQVVEAEGRLTPERDVDIVHQI